MGDHHHKPDTTRCGCGVHRGDFRLLTTPTLHQGLRHHSPTPQGAAVVAVPSSDRHHDGGLAADSPYSTTNQINQHQIKYPVNTIDVTTIHGKYKQEIGSFIGFTVEVVAILPSTACHGWKNRRCCCCGGCGGGMAVVVGGGCGCCGVGNRGKGWRLVALHGDDSGSGVVMAVGVFAAAAAMVVPAVEGGSGGAWRPWVVDRETGNNFWGSPEKFVGKFFRWRRPAAGSRKW
nr:hypothetical protein [Tanacetum cinerariifolium]